MRSPSLIVAGQFECPCHGSRYDRLGVKVQELGPAPRGMDRFAHTVDDGDLIVATRVVGTTVAATSPDGTVTADLDVPDSAGAFEVRVQVTDPETGHRVVADTARPEVRRALAEPVFEKARQVFKKTRVDAVTLSTAESRLRVCGP